MRKLAAELIGTFWLVFGGCGSAVLAAGMPEDRHPDASPRDEIIFALCRESPYELWMAKVR